MEYEGLNLVCFGCGQFEHKKEQCKAFDKGPEIVVNVK